MCFPVRALQDRIFFANPQLSDGASAVPLAQIGVEASQKAGQVQTEINTFSSNMLLPPLGSLPVWQ